MANTKNTVVITANQYKEELTAHFNDGDMLSDEMRQALKGGPMLRIVAGMKASRGLIDARDHDDEERVRRTGQYIDRAVMELSGFKWRDRMAGEKAPGFTTAQKIAVERRNLAIANTPQRQVGEDLADSTGDEYG